MTNRLSTITWFGLFALAAFSLYLVKYRVQDVRDEVVALQSELAKEKEALVILDAEWSYLNRPERLRQLSQRYLHLSPLSPGALIDISALPFRDMRVALHQPNDEVR